MERVWQRQYANHAEAIIDIAAYIVGFYNCERLNSVLGNLPPTFDGARNPRPDGAWGRMAERSAGKDTATGRMSGRARDGRLVHFAAPADADVRPGDLVEATVTYAAPHHLNADGPIVSHRRTKAGDTWEAGRTPRTPAVLLGMPTKR